MTSSGLLRGFRAILAHDNAFMNTDDSSSLSSNALLW